MKLLLLLLRTCEIVCLTGLYNWQLSVRRCWRASSWSFYACKFPGSSGGGRSPKSNLILLIMRLLLDKESEIRT